MKENLSPVGFWLNMQLIIIGIYIIPQRNFFDQPIYIFLDRYFDELQLGLLFLISGSINIFFLRERYEKSLMKIGFQGLAAFCWLIQVINAMSLNFSTVNSVVYSILLFVSLFLIVSKR